MSKAWSSRYDGDVLKQPAPKRPATPLVQAQPGLVVEDVESGWVGAVTSVEAIGGVTVVALEDRRGRSKSFPLGPGFWVDGSPVELVAPEAGGGAGGGLSTDGRAVGAGGGAALGRRESVDERRRPRRPLLSASGSRAVADHTARVARRSRIWVEGTHDAELIEKIWGHDLRVEGVVVEPLGGVDSLPDRVRDFAPEPGRRLGILVDHLVAGSKETAIVRETLQQLPGNEHVLIVGHPFVDIWQAVKPARVGLAQWPSVPRNIEFKVGILRALQLPSDTLADKAAGWQYLLGKVRHYGDLEPALLGRVEHLIDHVTADPDDA